MIRIEQAHIGYHTPILTVEKLHLEQRKLYVLLGKNGAGKSTFLKSLLGELPILRGQLLLDGKPVADIAQQVRATLIAFVSSRPAYAEYLSVEEYVALGRTPYLNSFAKLTESDRAIIADSLKKCGIEHLASQSVDAISDGERQLAAVAKALAQRTPILLLDEPTAYLDYSNKRILLSLLNKLAVEDQKCILITSHDVELTLNTVDHFIIIDKNTKELSSPEHKPTLDSLIQTVF